MAKLKLAAILVNTLFFIDSYGADPRFVASLHETSTANTLLIDSVTWLLDRPWQLLFSNTSSSSSSNFFQASRTSPTAEQVDALSKLLEEEYSHLPEKAVQADKTQRLCKGLIQYILLERYTAHNWKSIEEPVKHLFIKIIYSSYHFHFPTYILSQSGKSLGEQIDRALTKLDQDFTEIFPHQKVPNSNTFKAVVARLLYILNNISKLSAAIIKLLNDPTSTSLSNELDIVFDDA